MVFSSLMFLFRFMPAFFLIYFLTPRRAKNLVLFLGSLVFYAWGEPIYVLLMLFSTGSDYLHGLIIEKARKQGQEKRAKAFLISSVVINLAMLGFFKYTDFLIGTVNGLTGLAIPLLKLPLPIGISFYTFQTMSYTIDVYRRKVPAQRNLITFGTFVTMFPQLIAGPVVQYKDVQRKLQERSLTAEGLTEGLRRFILGLGKKVLLANQAGALYAQISGWGEAQMTFAAAWSAMLCFAFQIYFDFSGYSDMAAGLGKMLGFVFPENFNYPYMARSVTDFWRRWHMSLSGWFREYVYIPLGGNQKGLRRQIFNILVVWALTGIWHGASWNFLLWGLWFGGFLILEKTWLLKVISTKPAVLGRIYTLLVVLGGWVLFSCTKLAGLGSWLKALVGLGSAGAVNRAILYELGSNAALFVLLAAGSTPYPAEIGRRLAGFGKEMPKVQRVWGKAWEAAWLLFVLGVSVAFLVDASYNPFLYFRF